MERRGRGAEDLDGGRPIEMIDPDVPGSGIGTADSSPRPEGEPGPSHSGVVGLAAVLIAVIAAWALSTNRNEAAVPPTTEPAPVEEPAPGLDTARIGVGPELSWERIMWSVGTADFRWINGAFVGDDGTTEWSVTPSLGPVIAQRPSVLTDRPGYFIVDASGARVLAPRVEQPDHLLVIGEDGAETRVDLPTKPTVTELVTRHHRLEVAVIGGTAVVAVHQEDRIDGAALAERLGIAPGDVLGVRVFNDRLSILTPGPLGSPPAANDFAFADGPFTVTERSAMAGIGPGRVNLYAIDLTDGSTDPAGIVPDAVDSLGVAGNRFVLEWYTSTPPAFVSTSTTGRSWAPPRDFSGIGRIDGDANSIYGVLLTTDIVARSTDGASTWERTPSPLREFDLTAARDHIVVTERTAPAPSLTYEVEVDGYVVSVIDGQRFELTELSTGSVTSGTIGDAESMASYDPYDGSLDLVDADGATIVSVSPSTLLLAADRAIGSAEPSPAIASARWAGGDPPEWAVDTLADLFGDTALRVDFVGGDDAILAVVTTTEGYRLFMAELPSG